MKMKHKIIGKCVLALVGIVLGMECQGRTIVSVIRSQMGDIERAIQTYAMIHQGKLPASLDELAQFTTREYESIKTPLLKTEDLIDPWGEPVEYIRSGGKYAIVSSGPDRKMGTEDDIVFGNSELYEKNWKAKYIQPVAEQETNAVQGATAGAVQPPVAVEKTQANRVPVTNRQHTYEHLEPKPPWKILLRVGVIVVGVMAVWRCFRKRKRENGIKAAIRFILECIIVVWAIILLYIIAVGAYYTWEHKRRHLHPSMTNIRTQLAQIEKAIEIYAMNHNHRFPESLDELFQFASTNYDYSEKPLLKKEDLIDPWGEPFGYERDGRKYVLWSSGPDKKLGTKDDFVEGWPTSYVRDWTAKHTQAVAEQETNTVQEATTGAIQPPVAIEKTQTNRVPVTATQPQTEPDETKTTPWQLPLLIAIIAIIGAITAWRCFRKK